MGRGMHRATEKLISEAHAILEEINPATVRAICYRLFVSGTIDSMGTNNTQKVSRALVYARENDMIPWKWIVDETRSVERTPSWSDKEEFARAVRNQYRRDNWDLQACRIEVWSEKGTVRGTLAPVLEAYAVGFQVLHGFGSATALNDAADSSAKDDKPRIVFYVGDYDCSGMCMSEKDLPERIERYGGKFELDRIALVEEDLKGLPGFPAADKSKDPRYKWYVKNYGTKCWELDALSPTVLRERVEKSIRGEIDWVAWERCDLIEKAEKETLAIFMKNWEVTKESSQVQ